MCLKVQKGVARGRRLEKNCTNPITCRKNIKNSLTDLDTDNNCLTLSLIYIMMNLRREKK